VVKENSTAEIVPQWGQCNTRSNRT